MPDSLNLVARALREVEEWERRWDGFERHPSMEVDPDLFEEVIQEYGRRLGGNYPFFHPRYAGQMLKPPHPVALAAYAAAQRINPNNHALDGGPPTSEMEKEVVAQLAAMLGFPDDALGHLTGGGTVANLEALFVARELHPGRKVAVCTNAHYTHRRMCHVLGVEAVTVAEDADGRMDLDALEDVLRGGEVGTVVATPGTTGLGVVDPVASIVRLARRHGARVHADAAYGGFFRILAGSSFAPKGFPASDLLAISECDSVVIDPHKHGLQPYGCGCVLLRDPTVGRFYSHDSPYTYFTSDDLHLGEISLECSRPGAAAGALWMTLRCIPMSSEQGLGPILSASLRAARDWAGRIDASDIVDLFSKPDLDILTCFPRVSDAKLSEVASVSQDVFREAMNDAHDPIFLSTYRLTSARFLSRHPGYEADRDDVTVLRSVLMKPEHELHIAHLHERLEHFISNRSSPSQ